MSRRFCAFLMLFVFVSGIKLFFDIRVYAKANQNNLSVMRPLFPQIMERAGTQLFISKSYYHNAEPERALNTQLTIAIRQFNAMSKSSPSVPKKYRGAMSLYENVFL